MSRGHRIRTMSLAALLAAGCVRSPAPTPPDPPEVAGRYGTEPATPAPDEGDFADQTFAWPLSEHDATQILLRTNVFAMNAISFEGAPSRQVQALNVVLDDPDAAALLDNLLEHGTPAGRLYALCGFQVVQPSRFDAMSARLGDTSIAVTTFRGCVRSRESVAEVLESIRQNQYGKEFRRDRERTYKYFKGAG